MKPIQHFRLLRQERTEMDLKEARKEIDRIDRQMTGLFRERLLLCDAIAK